MTPSGTSTQQNDPSAYEKAAEQRIDPRCVPIQLEGPIPVGTEIPYPAYSSDEQSTWRFLYDRQRQLLPGRACAEYLEGLALMGFPEDRIPALADIHAVLKRTTGWQVARAPGLLHEQDFFDHLGRSIFPSTDYIRPQHELDYTPAPDLFHDMFGHTPMITNPAFAGFYRKIGLAASRAQASDRRRIERFYWFTVEFGLIQSGDGLRIYGNGILSSFKEVQHSLTDAVTKLPFTPERVVEQDYDVWHLQPLLFVIDSFEQLERGFDAWARGRGLL